MEHRHERRVACELNIELFRAGKRIGKATTLDISKDGLHIRTDVRLKRNERIDVVFLDQDSIPDWPAREHAMVAHTEEGHAGLWFGTLVKR